MPREKLPIRLASSPEVRIYPARAGATRLTDALNLFSELQPGLSEDWTGKITTKPFLLNGNSGAYLILVTGPRVSSDTRIAIAMPSSAAFVTTSTLGSSWTRSVAELDGAVFDTFGNITLRDGTHLHNLEFRRSSLPMQLTPRQMWILNRTLRFLNEHRACCRVIHRDLHHEIAGLDFAKIRSLQVSTFKELQRFIEKEEKKWPRFSRVSRQSIAEVLTLCGIGYGIRSGGRSSVRRPRHILVTREPDEP